MKEPIPENQYIGKPCPRGHALRYKHSKNCVVCCREVNDRKRSAPEFKKKAAEYVRNRRSNDPEFAERVRDGQRRRYQNNPAVRKMRVENSRRWAADNKDKKRELALKRKFGIDNDHYEAMLSAQNGVCACCGQTDDRRLAVDHDHATGKIRELLCGRCNVAVGILENPLASIWLAYLEKHNGNQFKK